MPTSFHISVDGDPDELELRPMGGWPHRVPERVQLRIAGAADGRDIYLDVVPQDDATLDVRRVSIDRTEDLPITAASFRSFRFETLVTAARIFVSGGGRTYFDDEKPFGPTTVSVIGQDDVINQMLKTDLERTFEGSSGVLQFLIPGQVDQEMLDALKQGGPNGRIAADTIVELYSYAVAKGLPPNRFVESILDMNSATVARWITAAREARPGVLPDNPRTRKPKTDTTDNTPAGKAGMEGHEYGTSQDEQTAREAEGVAHGDE